MFAPMAVVMAVVPLPETSPERVMVWFPVRYVLVSSVKVLVPVIFTKALEEYASAASDERFALPACLPLKVVQSALVRRPDAEALALKKRDEVAMAVGAAEAPVMFPRMVFGAMAAREMVAFAPPTSAPAFPVIFTRVLPERVVVATELKDP